MSLFQNFPFRLLLASKSPRRKALLEEMDICFEVLHLEVEETYPPEIGPADIPLFLVVKKANSFTFDESSKNTLLITADTIVLLGENVLGKPKNREEAIEMLERLSGKTHRVITAVCLRSTEKEKSFSETTQVRFRELTKEEIIYYVDTYQPYDKAGAYGIQEWIGYVGVEQIEGSYFNVMGLPTERLYIEIKNWI